MKIKTIFILFCISLAMITTSCKRKKNWQCDCIISNPGASGYEKEHKEILDCKESEASGACDDYGKTWVYPGGNSTCTVTAE